MRVVRMRVVRMRMARVRRPLPVRVARHWVSAASAEAWQ
jgi:hypothetical protein